MELYLLRHGRSVNASDWEGDDDSRPLTKEGKAAMAHEAATLARLGLAPDAIVTSPLVRARETAEIVATGLPAGIPLETDDRLRSGFRPKLLRQILRGHPDAARLLLVGHEPDLSSVVGKLTGARVQCSKGGLVRVDLAENHREGTLIWLLQADQLDGESLVPPTATAESRGTTRRTTQRRRVDKVT